MCDHDFCHSHCLCLHFINLKTSIPSKSSKYQISTK